MTNILVMHTNDDVGVAVDGVELGAEVTMPDGRAFRALESIPPGHKLALRDIAKGTEVHKYGSPIGVASEAIRLGQHVHIHNLNSGRARREASGS